MHWPIPRGSTMSPPKPVALDTSLLVDLLDGRDIWHPVAVTLRDALKGAQAQMVYPVRNNAPLEFLTGFTLIV
jgi:hypothetical protein